MTPFATKLWLVALLSVPLFPTTGAQPLYMPRSVKQAFKNGTRAADGRPGPKYWENHGRYAMTLTIAPPNRTISGTEQITYLNNSPDALSALVIKLFLNIHKPGAPRSSGASEAYLTSGVHIDSFAVNGQPSRWNNNPQFFTWQSVKLSTPLMPRDSVRLSFAWHYEISRESGREGMLDSTTYYLAYFYPRVAVYDDVDGWDRTDFTDAQEFYNDFNDYDVSIQVPANYVAWGTGTLLNPEAVLQPEPLQRFKASLASDEVIHVATKDELAARRVTTQSPTPQAMNTWHFRAANVTDVAFAVSDHYDWDAASVVVDDATRRRASVQAAYNDTAADFHHMVQFGRHALDWLSHNWPGVPYPYEKTTIVQGEADMEYPMMVNDATAPDTVFSRAVAEHEIAHTYFPFYMGINETRYAFMDEGWATALEHLAELSNVGQERENAFFERYRVSRWAHDPSAVEDLPIITPEDVLAPAAYGNNAYGKAAIGYLALKDLLGDATFRKGLHAFIERWHGKHPLPWDFFNTFNDVADKNLNWFWHNWFFTNNYIDLAVGGVKKTDTGYSLVIENIGGMAAPVDVRVRYSDGSTETMHETPAIWEPSQQRVTVPIATRKTIQSLDLDGGIWMDADSTNNRWMAGH